MSGVFFLVLQHNGINSSPFIDVLKVKRVSMCMSLNIQVSFAWLGLLGLQELQGLLVSLGLREELETLD